MDDATYEVEVLFASPPPLGTATITAGNATTQLDIPAGKQLGNVAQLTIPAGKVRLDVEVNFGGKNQRPHQVILRRR
ncbi:MAG: hypothetical protein WBD31_14300 [Rubripirellula sp.]